MASPRDYDEKRPSEGDKDAHRFQPLSFLKGAQEKAPPPRESEEEEEAGAETTRRLDSEELQEEGEAPIDDGGQDQEAPAGGSGLRTLRLDVNELETGDEAPAAGAEATARLEGGIGEEEGENQDRQATQRFAEPQEDLVQEPTRRIEREEPSLPAPPAHDQATPPGGFGPTIIQEARPVPPRPAPHAEPTVRLQAEDAFEDPGMQRTQRVEGVDEFGGKPAGAVAEPMPDTVGIERPGDSTAGIREGTDGHVTLEDSSAEALARTRVDVQDVGRIRDEGPRPAFPAAAPRPAAPADMEPVRPEEEEVPRTFNLQPEDPELIELATQASQDSRPSEPVRHKWLWPLVGLVIGSGLCAWGYLRPWSIPFKIERPEHEALEVERFGQYAPPGVWVLEGDLYFGRDETVFQQPWIYDFAGGDSSMRRGASRAPFDPSKGMFALVARPPLERLTQLAWIRDSRTDAATTDAATTAAAQMPAGYLLEWREYDFLTAEQTRNNEPGEVVAAPPPIVLPDVGYGFAPAAVDGASPEAGILLAVVDQEGLLSAWPMSRQEVQDPTWQTDLKSPPLGKPWLMPTQQGEELRYWLVTATTAGVAVVEAATGKAAGQLAWPETIDRGRRVAVIPARTDGDTWGAFVSDGRHALLLRLEPDGRPAAAWQATLPEDLGGTGLEPQLLSFVDGRRPEMDAMGIVSTEGRIAIYDAERRQSGSEPILLNAPGPAVAALDVNQDAYWDLVGLAGESGQFWVAPGPAYEPLPADGLPQIDQPASPGSPVLWQLDGGQLVADFFDRGGGPHRVSLTLPSMKQDALTLLQRDWKRRHERF